MDTNQKQKSSIVNRKLSIILLLAAILFAGCKENTPVDNPDNPVNVVMQNLALNGIVKDASGKPLSGVKVTTGTLNATTGNDGTFTFSQAGTVNNRAIVKFEKSGYFTQTRSGDKADEMYIEAMLYRKGNDSISLQTDFDASAAKTLQVGGIKIELPAGCMAKADGSAYNGTVRADVLDLSFANKNAAWMMPCSDLACVRSDKSEKMIMPYGIMDVVFTDNAGNPLKIKDKTNIPISFPAPSGATDASIPLWSFDEATGVWVEDGALTYQGNVYTGTVSHFSPKAAGLAKDQVTVTIQATACNEPASGTRIFIDYYGWYDEYPGEGLVNSGTTNSSGLCKLKVPANEKITINTTYDGKGRAISFQTGNSDSPTVIVKFDENCENDDFLPERCAVRITSRNSDTGWDESYCLTWDNYGQLIRQDNYVEDTGGDCQYTVQIWDYISNLYIVHEDEGEGPDKGWSVSPNPTKHEIDDYNQWACIAPPDEYYKSRGYTRRPATETILGKPCNVWDGPATEVGGIPLEKHVVWKWKRIKMRVEKNGVKTWQLSKITDNVPPEAFGKTMAPSWIK